MFEHQYELVAPPPLPQTAQTRWAEWMSACRDSNRMGGDNYLKSPVGGFILDSRPKVLQNGAIVGRVHQFVANGLRDIGGFKIAADSTVAECPDVVRPFLPGAKVDQVPHASA